MVDWKQALGDAITTNESKMKANEASKITAQEAAEHFYMDIVMPALREFKEEVEKHGFTSDVHGSGVNASIYVKKDNEQVMRYEVRSRISANGASVYPYTHHIDEKRGAYQAEGSYPHGSITELTKEELLNELTQVFKSELYYLSRRQR